MLQEAMNGENWLLVTDEPVEFENNWLKCKNLGKLPIILEESMDYNPNLMKKNQKMSTDHASKSPQILPGS
jgi:hypothetical protein